MSDSRFNDRARLAPSSNDSWARRIQPDAPSLDAIPSPWHPAALGSFSDEPTVQFDARVLSRMVARSASEAQEETRTYQIPAEVLAVARGDRTAPGRAVTRARPGSPLVVPVAHVLVVGWAIALGYFLVQMIDG